MHSLKPSGYGTWLGANASLTLEFNSKSARITHRDGSVNLELIGYGRGDRLRKPAHAKLNSAANRLEYQREDITEWYLNTSKGLEQGFALEQRPRSDRKGEPLVVALRVSGGLHPFQRTGDESVLFRSSSSVVLRYEGLRALDARGRTLPSRLELRGGEIRLIISDQAAQYPLVVDPIWTQQQGVTASGGEPGDVLSGATGDEFGYSVSMSGDTAVIGARNRTVNSQANQGAAYVFVRSGGLWTQQQELTASDGAVNDSFGQAVSVSGDTAVIGANGKNGYQGAAYVFVRNGGVWSQQQELNASDGAANDQFGGSVSLGGSTVVIGAWGKTIDLNALQGSAYAFVQISGVWNQQQELTATDGAMNDAFGQSVSLSGNTALIGANGRNGGEGSAYVFIFDGTTWGQVQELTGSDSVANDSFGQAVSLSADTALIGAVGKGDYQGAAYVFVRSGGWSQQQELSAYDGAANDQFGGSVSLSGDTAVIGAPGHYGSLGAAYMFVLSAGTWTQQQELTALDGAMNDAFGWSSSVSGDTSVIGAMENSNGQGAAYAFVSSASAAQTIGFLALGNQVFEAAPFNVSATASSGLPVGFASTSLSVCTVSGVTVTLVAAGTCTIVAYQSGNAYYAGAPSVVQSFDVLPGNQTIAFGALASVPLGTAPFTIGATASSGLPVSFASPAPAVCAVSDAMVTLLSVGVCSIWATQPGNIDYAAAAPVMQSFEVTQGGTAGPNISSLSPASAALGGTAFQLAVGGEGFLPGAAVMWNGTALSTSFVSTTSLTAQVRASLIASAGTATVTVVNPGGAAAGGVAFPVWPELGTDALLVGSAGGTSSVVLPYDGAWTATADDSFLHVSPGSGSGIGSAVVLFSYDAFTGTGSRTGTLTIAGLTVTVTQAGKDYIGPIGPGPAIALVWADMPFGAAVDSSGNVYIADSQNGAIKEWNASTRQVTTLLSSGLNDPCGVAVDSSGNVYIADSADDTIKEWSASTRQVTTLVSSGLNGPCGVAVDRSGNVYAADTFNSEIKEWSASTQQVTTLVSSGLKDPFALAVDGSGNVYIADTENGAIKEWSASTQQVTTLVSSGLFMPFGVAVDGSGNVYIADTFNLAIKEWSASAKQVTTLASRGLLMPFGVAVDGSGNVYIADTFNNAIKELPYAFVGPASLAEPAAAGTDSLLPVLPSTAPLTGVYAPTSDSSWLTIESVANGIVSFSFAGATSNSNVAHISLLGQQITITQNALPAQTITFGVLADQPLGTPPFTVEATASSGLTVRFNSQTTSVCTVAGNTVTLVAVGTCTIQATQSGSVNYSAATAVNQSFQVTPASSSAPVISSVSPASAPRGGSAFMLTVNGAGFLDGAEVMWDGTTLWTTFVSGTTLSAWVSDSQITSVGTATVAVVNPGGTATAGVSFTIWPGLGTNTLLVGSAAATSSVVLPYSGAWTAAANDSFLHIAAGSASGTGSALIVFSYDAFTSTGSRTGTLTIAGLTVTVTQAGTSYIGPFGPGPLITLASSGLNGPYGVAVDGSGNVYVADSQNSVIREWNASTQQMTTLVSSGLNVPSGVAVDNSGNIYIADTVNNAIKKWNASTQQVTTLVSSGLNGPSSVAVDGSGNVYIADTLNGAIKEWSAATQQVTALVSSGLFLPFGVAVDGSGNVYIADTFNNAIREWSVSTQQVTTLVSSGLKSPRGVAVDGSGNIYIADTLHGAIEEWSASTRQITTLASSGLDEPYGVAVDGSGNVYIADTFNNAAKELPYAFVGPASLTEPTSAGTDSLLPVLPSTAPLTGVYAPTSDSGWLTIGTVANGVVSLSFAANMQTSRIAHVALLGQQITVTQNTMAAQTITFGALPSRPLGTAPFAASATASSGLPVTFASLTPFVCTVAGNTVTLVAVGTCTIRATQSGNASYWAAEAVDQSFQVTQTSQTITFGAIANQPLGTAPFAVSATASSSLPVSFASTTLTVCRVAGNTVTLVGVGTCTIQATQAGNTSYSAATAVNQSFQVTQTSQSITFGALADRVFGSALFTVSGTASSGLPVSFASTTLTVCTVAGNTVTLVGVGTCTIQATQPGNSNYAAATAVNRSFTVTQASQTITFGALIDRVFGSALFTVSGTASSGLPVSFASITLTVCRVAGNTVTLVGVGTCTIQATQAGNTTYLPATPVNQSYQVTQASQTITFGVLANQPYGTVPFTVTATASSGLTVSFASQTNSTCTVVGSAVTLFTVSTCTIQATQAGNTNYAAATAVNRSFTVTQASQTVSFGALANRPLGTAPFTVSATASSGLPVSFASATSTVCTVAGNVVTLLSAGICIVQAAQAGNATYSAATAVNQPFQVTQTSQTISFDALANRVLGTAPFTATATASSGLPVSFLSTTLTVCTVAGNTVTLAGVGTCTIRATQGGNTTYPPATPVNQGFQVTQASQTITFGVLASQPCGIAPFTVTATASSGLTVSFGSQTTSVCTVSGSLVILVAVGTCTIQATQAGNATYAAATPVDQSFQVTAELSSAPAISSLSPWSAAPGGAAFTLTVNGTDFVSGATVDWNGTALTTHFASATKLTASVPATLITSAGIATVTVVDPGAVTSGGVGFTIQFGPAATAVSPGAGKGANQTFAFTFSDPVGYQNLGVLDVLINNYLDGIQACYIAVVPSGANGGTVYLVDDGGDAGGPFAGYLALPGTGSVSNSQCTVSGAGSSVVGSGTTLTLTLNISFTSSFAGDRIFYTAARDTGTGNSGWQALSTRQVPGATATPTQATGVTPASGSGASQSFVFTFADSAGWQNLGVVDMLFNNFLDGIQGCYIAYSVPAATLYLVDDAGDAGGPFAGYLALPGTGSVSNSQCTVNGTGSSSAGSGNTLTLTLNVSFTPAFAGNRVFYTAAGNAAGTENSGWQALGAWTVP